MHRQIIIAYRPCCTYHDARHGNTPAGPLCRAVLPHSVAASDASLASCRQTDRLLISNVRCMPRRRASDPRGSCGFGSEVEMCVETGRRRLLCICSWRRAVSVIWRCIVSTRLSSALAAEAVGVSAVNGCARRRPSRVVGQPPPPPRRKGARSHPNTWIDVRMGGGRLAFELD